MKLYFGGAFLLVTVLRANWFRVIVVDLTLYVSVSLSAATKFSIWSEMELLTKTKNPRGNPPDAINSCASPRQIQPSLRACSDLTTGQSGPNIDPHSCFLARPPINANIKLYHPLEVEIYVMSSCKGGESTSSHQHNFFFYICMPK